MSKSHAAPPDRVARHVGTPRDPHADAVASGHIRSHGERAIGSPPPKLHLRSPTMSRSCVSTSATSILAPSNVTLTSASPMAGTERQFVTTLLVFWLTFSSRRVPHAERRGAVPSLIGRPGCLAWR
jgi:hypothetical protein